MLVCECVFMSLYVSQRVKYKPKAIRMETVGGSVANHSTLMKVAKCHFNLHSVYHVAKILVQVEPERRISSGVKVGKD